MQHRIANFIASALIGLATLATRLEASPVAPAGEPRASLPYHGVATDTVLDAGPREGVRPQPSGIAADAFGRLFVADAGLHGLLRLDASGRLLGQAGSLGSEAGTLRRPTSVVLLGTLRVAVLDSENRRVVTYDLFDRLQGTLIDFEALVDPPGRIDPASMAADRGGAVFVADRDRDRVVVFDFAGRFVRVLGGFGNAPGSFREPSGVAVNRLGELVVSERVGRRVQRLDPGGRVLATWPLPASNGELSVATDDSLRVAVADEALGAAWVFDARGRKMAEIDGLDRPSALAYAPNGTLLIAERGGGRVVRWSLVARAPDAED